MVRHPGVSARRGMRRRAAGCTPPSPAVRADPAGRRLVVLDYRRGIGLWREGKTERLAPRGTGQGNVEQVGGRVDMDKQIKIVLICHTVTKFNHLAKFPCGINM